MSLFWFGRTLSIYTFVEVRYGRHLRYDHFPALALAVIFDDPAVSGGIRYVVVIVSSAFREHIVGAEKLDGLLCRCCSVKHEADCIVRCDGHLSRILIDRLAVKCKYRNRDTLLVYAVEADEGRSKSGELLLDTPLRFGRGVIESLTFRPDGYLNSTLLLLRVRIRE